jgi:hypothetical protein
LIVGISVGTVVILFVVGVIWYRRRKTAAAQAGQSSK